MKAIFTRYLGATNTKGSRIKAYDGDGNKITLAFDYALSGEAIFKKAAVALCEKMNWPLELLGGGFKGNYVFVFKNQ